MLKRWSVVCVWAVAAGLVLTACRPKPTLEDVAPMMNVGEVFLQAFKEGNAVATFNLFTPDAQRSAGGAEAWAKVVASGKADKTLPSQWKIASTEIANGAGLLRGTVMTKGEKQLLLTFVKVDGVWRISNLSIK